MGKIADKLPEVTNEQWATINSENRSICEEYLRESVNLSPYTLKQYESCLRQYFWWVKENAKDKPFYELKSRDYMLFQNFLTRRGLSSSAIKLKRSTISSLNNYVCLYYGEEYEKFRNYITKAIANPPPAFVHEKEPLTLDEYAHLCDELENQGLLQQLAYLKFSFSTGCRRNEVKQLLKEVATYEPKIVKSGEKEIKTYMSNPIRCKGRGTKGKVRSLMFDQEAMDAINKWLLVRGDDDCLFVFAVKHEGKYVQINEATFNSWCDKIFEPIVGRRVHPHLFRETRATTLVVEQGKDIRAAQRLLGHESSETTQIYVIRNDENDADEAFI